MTPFRVYKYERENAEEFTQTNKREKEERETPHDQARTVLIFRRKPPATAKSSPENQNRGFSGDRGGN